jgi:hypothetical protein
MGRPSPFNGRWGLTYSSNFRDYLQFFGIHDEALLDKIDESLSTYYGDDRLCETYFIDNDAGLITRTVSYKGESVREGKGQPFDQIVHSKYFDKKPVKYIFCREDGKDDTIVRFELGNQDKVHAMVVTSVYGNNNEHMISTYTCRGKTWIKTWIRMPDNQ